MPYCPFCGTENSDEDSFCRSCGAMLNGGSAPAPSGPNAKKVFVILIAISLLFAGLAGAILWGLLESGRQQETADITVTYSWTYENEFHFKVPFTYTLTVERSYYNRMMSSQIDRTGTTSADRYIDDGKVVFAVSDYIVVDEYIKKVSADLQALYKEKFGDFAVADDYVKFVTAFVQICIEYDTVEAETGEYWRYPLETLCDGKGDCEDTSILLAALIDAKDLGGGVILVPSHAMCAVRSSDLALTYYYNLNHSSVYDTDFYPIETTYDEQADIGEISVNMEPLYLHLYMGSSSDYYFKS